MRNWWIGCSGFSYRHWKGTFYPDRFPQKKWFEFYCEHFNTVELNVTFYRLPKPEVLKGWFNRSPDEFRFTVKAPRLITHYKKFTNITDEVTRFYDLIGSTLHAKLGTILFQLHPRYEFTEENLERLLEHLDPAFTNVIEFRHSSWWNNKVYKSLTEHGITFCSISYPGLPDEVIKTNASLYYRFHGVPQLYKSSYSEEQLESVVGEIKRFRKVTDIYVYFNNDIDVHAIHNAKTVQLLTGTFSKSTSAGVGATA
jgi:uncharacterized protein YecE (DUF72 family)